MSKNTFKTYVLMAGLGGMLVLVGSFFGRGGAIIGLLIGLAFVGGSYWFSDKLAIRSARAVPVTEAEMPEYYRIVRELSTEAGMPMPALYVTPDLQPNAFATGRNPQHAAVAVTRGILNILDWSELRGVLAHELSHVGNRDILIGSVAAAVAMGITFVARMAMWGAMFGGGGGDDDNANPIALLAFAVLAPLAAAVLQMSLSRSREFEADRTGARLIHDGEPLARALAKLDQGARAIPMAVDPAQASKYIVNPLSGRKVQFAKLVLDPPADGRADRPPPGTGVAVLGAWPTQEPVDGSGRWQEPDGPAAKWVDVAPTRIRSLVVLAPVVLLLTVGGLVPARRPDPAADAADDEGPAGGHPLQVDPPADRGPAAHHGRPAAGPGARPCARRGAGRGHHGPRRTGHSARVPAGHQLAAQVGPAEQLGPPRRPAAAGGPGPDQ